MYNACDVNDHTRVTTGDLRNFIEGLTHTFKQKEVHSLISYLDIDKTGFVEKDDFIRQLTKGEQTLRQTSMLNKQIADQRSI